ncbi:RHS repeat-associated core domain-containing protein [Flavobacterium sp. ENC]|uniref:RHS repeat-associated core domain-containing protein n=1 Tax=Flavobacterium sp. ENC TaxID=2897330 RepID=UPI001E42695C|nr:hypothetical protein [Flavobacterium sp. ENC]
MVEKRLFDAWGSIQKVQNGAGMPLSGLTVLDRGYTGHEHIQSVGLINMNGHIYDPNLHCFLQPDNNIQDPFNTQNYNRYGYVLNNPLKYTDPSGEFINVFFGYLLSGYIMGAYASGGELNPAKWNSSAFITIGAAGASAGASAVATNLTNNYLDNYNKPPVLGFSAVGSGNDIHSFVNDNNDFSFSEDNRSNNVFDFKSVNNIKLNIPLIVQYNEHLREPYDKYNATGGVLTALGTSLAFGEYKMFNKETWYSIKKMKTYGQHFNGNGATGGKVTSALKISNRINRVGKLLGAYNARSIFLDYRNGEINKFNFVAEEGSNAYATFGGTYGAAWGVGWEMGRWITSWDSYQNWKRETVLPWREQNFGY